MTAIEGSNSPFSPPSSDLVATFDRLVKKQMKGTQGRLFQLISLVNQEGLSTEFTAYAIQKIVRKQVITKCPIFSFHYLSMKIQNRSAIVEAIWNHFIHYASIKSDLDHALWLGAEVGSQKLVREALSRGADVNVEIGQGNTPLLRACKGGYDRIVYHLLRRGANPQLVSGTHDHQTPFSEVLLQRNKFKKSFKKLKNRDNGFTLYFLNTKYLGHFFSLRNRCRYGLRQFEMEGFRPRYIFHHFLEKGGPFYRKFVSEIHAQRGENYERLISHLPLHIRLRMVKGDYRESVCFAMIRSFEEIQLCHSGPVRYDLAMERLQKRGVLMLYGVTRHRSCEEDLSNRLHAWGLVISKTKELNRYDVFLCDRSTIIFKASGVYQMQVDADKIERLIKAYNGAAEWKGDLHREGFDNVLKEIGNSCVKLYVIEQKEQNVGNCCYYSFQALDYALLCATLANELPCDANRLADAIRKIRTHDNKISVLKKYLQDHLKERLSDYPIDWDNLLRLYSRCFVRKRYYFFRRILVNFFLKIWEEKDQLSERIKKKINWFIVFSILTLENKRFFFNSIDDFNAEDVESLFEVFSMLNVSSNDRSRIVSALVFKDREKKISGIIFQYYLIYHPTEFIEVVAKKLLMLNLIDPNLIFNDDGETMLFKIGDGIDVETAEILIELGADVNAVNHRGETPLGYYLRLHENDWVSDTFIRYVSMLLSRGAQKGETDYVGYAPWHHALKYPFGDRWHELVSLLLPVENRHNAKQSPVFQSLISIFSQNKETKKLDWLRSHFLV